MILGRIPYRYLTRHPWQSLLMILGIALGVAVAVAIDLANASAARAFDLSTEAVAGRATHTIVGGPLGLDEALYAQLRQSGQAAAAAPVISEYISSPELGGGLLQLLGVDVFAEAPFRDYLGGGEGSTPPLAELVGFLTQPGAVIMSTELAQRYALGVGDALTLEVGGRAVPAWVAALIEPQDDLTRRALESLLLTDLASAQEITGRLGKLDRIDLILPAGAGLAAEIQAGLPEGVRVQTVSARSGTIEQMTAAFRINLTALSLLALVVGLFLIYNTMTFSVVQRRPMFGTLRCLGMTRGEVFGMVIGEALLVGAAGAGLGLGLGVLLGQGAVQLVTRTINDLYFVVNVQGIQVQASSLVKGALLGIVATALTAAPPAWEAASVPPRLALSRSGLEAKARTAVWLAAAGGLALFRLGVGLLLTTRDLVASFVGTLGVVVGFAMLAPAVTLLLARAVTPLAGWLWGALGRMAPRNVVQSLSRTSVVTAALMVAVSVSIGVSLMVGSFRNTVITWLGEILQGDIYISAPSLTATQSSAAIDPGVLAVLAQQPGVLAVHTLRSLTVDSPQGPVNVAAGDNPQASLDRSYLSLDAPLEALPERLLQGAVLVSEPFANRLGLPEHGAVVSLYTDRGQVDFPVLGIYYDYASTAGTVWMALEVYRQHWEDPTITAASLDLQDGADADTLAAALQAVLNPLQQLSIRPNRVLRAEVLEVFDRTFAITSALQLLATLVAFMGVLSALLSLELERQRELGILRSLGLTARQLWGLVLLETGLLGSVAGLLALPTGYVLALILVYIINRRSFGWTLQMQVLPEPFVQALLLAVAAALLAGIYPAWRMSRMSAADASRFD